MKLIDFKNNPQELIGKTVIYESGMTHSEYRRRSLMKIIKVTKTGFKLFSMPDTLFNFDGSEKGLNIPSRMAIISKCELVTEEEADILRAEWKQQKQVKQLREKMKAKLETMTFEQLKKMELL